MSFKLLLTSCLYVGVYRILCLMWLIAARMHLPAQHLPKYTIVFLSRSNAFCFFLLQFHFIFIQNKAYVFKSFLFLRCRFLLSLVYVWTLFFKQNDIDSLKICRSCFTHYSANCNLGNSRRADPCRCYFFFIHFVVFASFSSWDSFYRMFVWYFFGMYLQLWFYELDEKQAISALLDKACCLLDARFILRIASLVIETFISIISNMSFIVWVFI